jgi:hypothetical protein
MTTVSKNASLSIISNICEYVQCKVNNVRGTKLSNIATCERSGKQRMMDRGVV